MLKPLTASPSRRSEGRVPPKDHLTMQRMFASQLRGVSYIVRPKGRGRYEVRTPQPQALIEKLTQGGTPRAKLQPGESRTYAFSGSDVKVIAETRTTFEKRGEQGWVGRPPRRGGNGLGGPMPEGFSAGRF